MDGGDNCKNRQLGLNLTSDMSWLLQRRQFLCLDSLICKVGVMAPVGHCKNSVHKFSETVLTVVGSS